MSAGTLIAVHGFLGSARDWDRVTVPGWSRVTWELPGHGERAHEAVYGSFEDAVRELVAFVQSLPRPRVVMGYSMGARIALGAAVEAAADMDALILESGRVGIADSGERAERRALDAQRAAALREMGSEAFLEQWYQQPLFATLAADPERLRARIADRVDHPADSWAAALEVLGTGGQPDYRDALSLIPIPVLALAGERDAAYVDHARALVSGALRGTLSVVPRAGHDVHSEVANVFCESIQRFLTVHFGA